MVKYSVYFIYIYYIKYFYALKIFGNRDNILNIILILLNLYWISKQNYNKYSDERI